MFDSTYADGGGTGLGLSIVERIAEAHDWAVTVTGSDAGGARFEVRASSVRTGTGGRG